jgi:hypothetical protein
LDGCLSLVCGKKSLHFGLGELIPVTLWHAFELEESDPNAHQPLHLIAEPIEHQPDLALQSLLQNHVHLLRSRSPSALCLGKTFGCQHALRQLCQRGGIHGFIQSDLILLLHTLTRMREALGEITAIGEQDETFALFIQPTHVMELLILRRQKIINRSAVMGITACAKVTLWLMERDDHTQGRPNRTRIHGDVVVFIHLCRQFPTNVSVHGHTTF